MVIKQIEVYNFKSFKQLNLDLQSFNVLIGANAAGKSNFVRVFAFLRNIAQFGLVDAISLEGGVNHLVNFQVGSSKHLKYKIIYNHNTTLGFQVNDGTNMNARITDGIYEFEIDFSDESSQFVIMKDRLTFVYEFFVVKPTQTNKFEQQVLGTGQFTIQVHNSKLVLDIQFPEHFPAIPPQIFPLGMYKDGDVGIRPTSLLMETPYFLIAHNVYPQFENIISGFDPFPITTGIYDIDPKLSQQAVPFTGKTELEDDASNLAIVLDKVLTDKEKRRPFINLLSHFLPHVTDLSVAPLANRLLITLQEKHQTNFLPAFLLSDGTMSVIALILVLYFDQKRLLLLEEPDRHLHPHLIERLVNALVEVSKRKQIILTTHNPEVVKYSPLENLLLISRDQDGYSVVTRPKEQETVQIFMENEIGIDDLFVKDLLGVPA